MQTTFSAGSVISRTLSVWGRNVVAFSAVGLLLNTPAFVLTLFTKAPRPKSSLQPLSGLSSVATVLLGFAVTGALTYGVLQALNGKTLRLGEIFSVGMRKLWPVLVASLAIGVAVGLWTLLLVVPGIIALCAYWVAIPAVVAEKDLPIRASFKRSRALTQGHRFQILAVLTLIFLAMMAMSTLIKLILLPLGTRGVVPYGLIAMLSQMLMVIAGGLYSTACAVAYHDLRVAKEGVDTSQLVAVFE